MEDKRKPASRDGELIAKVFVWFIVVFLLTTVAGIWVKIFWIGWVLR